jgi:WD40 repeat protein
VELTVWDADAATELFTLRGHTAPVFGVAWGRDPVADRQRLASISEDGTVKLWDVSSGQEVLTLRAQGNSHFTSVAWDAEGRQLCTCSSDGTVKVWTAAVPAAGGPR